jgi:ubiquinone/menaquinone biosynthesis C-methylase UbiE
MVPKFSSEQEKYIWLNENSSYAKSSNIFAEPIFESLLSLQMTSVCDVGTGGGAFCQWAVDNGCKNVYGVDFAIDPVFFNEGIKYIKAFAHDIPLPDDAVEYVTSFDMLEHVPEEDIDATFEEFQRLASKGWVFSIAHFDSMFFREVIGSLHPTVKPRDWWYDKISKYGEVSFLPACNGKDSARGHSHWLVIL